jgi:transposase
MSLDEQAKTMEHQDIVALLASHGQLATQNTELVARNQELARQLAWFKQQLFGEKSERRFVDADSRQLALGEWRASVIAGKEITVAEHHRRSRPKSGESIDEDAVRFDETVPVEEIRLPHPTIDEEHEIVSEKTTLRLAQKPASYVILKFVRPVIKRKADGALTCPPAPASVLGKSIADVSLLACLVVDKFLYHLPLYRQHQRMAAAGVHLARSTLTGLIHRTGDLLEPIVEAQLASILQSHTLAMDETPIRAGIKSRGQMKTGYFWPIYGDRDEVVFPFSESRSGAILKEILGNYSGVLLSDGYVAYERHAEKHDAIVHAQCWSHTRRQFLKAEAVEPELTDRALAYIARLYEADAVVTRKMVDDAKRAELRAERCKPIVDEFFEWLKTTLDTKILLPRNPFTEAAGYALAREAALRVFLQFPNVPIDTNHLEREIRPIAVGRKNWLFCWTEVGAQYVGIFQSLLVTCRLQGIDPYTYLVDLLQRVDRQPASDVAALTPRVWKERFAGDPLRSVIDRTVKNAVL